MIKDYDAFLNPIADAMLEQLSISGKSELGFENQETANRVAALLDHIRRSSVTGIHYDIRAEPMDSLRYPDRWQVIIERREVEGGAE